MYGLNVDKNIWKWWLLLFVVVVFKRYKEILNFLYFNKDFNNFKLIFLLFEI